MDPIKIGQEAPSFVLKDHLGTEHSLPSLRGRRVLLSFHPLAWTGVCQRQMEALEMNADRWEQLNVSAFGVSVDSAPCKKAWAQSIHVEKTPLLADFWPHGGLARALGLFREQEGFSERANVLIDENGVVRWIKIYPLPEAPDIEELMDAIRKLGS